MSKERKTYTRGIKLEAIRLADTRGRSIPQVEFALGLGQGMIAHWRGAVRQNGAGAFSSRGYRLPSEERLRQLERENAISRHEHGILKNYRRGLIATARIYQFIAALAMI